MPNTNLVPTNTLITSPELAITACEELREFLSVSARNRKILQAEIESLQTTVAENQKEAEQATAQLYQYQSWLQEGTGEGEQVRSRTAVAQLAHSLEEHQIMQQKVEAERNRRLELEVELGRLKEQLGSLKNHIADIKAQQQVIARQPAVRALSEDLGALMSDPSTVQVAPIPRTSGMAAEGAPGARESKRLVRVPSQKALEQEPSGGGTAAVVEQIAAEKVPEPTPVATAPEGVIASQPKEEEQGSDTQSQSGSDSASTAGSGSGSASQSGSRSGSGSGSRSRSRSGSSSSSRSSSSSNAPKK